MFKQRTASVGEGLVVIYTFMLKESENTMLSDLLRKIDEVRKHVPDEIIPGLIAATTCSAYVIQTSSEVYVFCGSDHFDKSIFMPITNEPYPWCKPRGGMWSSPADSDNTWEDWCLSNGFRLEKLDKQFRFHLAEGSKILRIKFNEDLDALYSRGYKRSDLDQYPYLHDDMYYLDFEKIVANGYDAIQVIITAETYWSLYGWDCDTLLVLNPDSVMEIE